LIVFGFGMVIVLATVLLSLPAASRSGQHLRLIDAFFTATSATCVTGLTVVDTGTHFTLFGQIVILCCIQIGGLGLMTFTTVFILATGRRIAIGDRIAIQESFYHSPTGKLGTLIRYLVLSTLLTEALGAFVLATWWTGTGVYPRFSDAIYPAVFHAISAFCNAGFGLRPDNLVSFRGDPVVVAITSGLIIAGGLGFLVGLDVKEYVQQRLFRSYWSGSVRERVDAIRPRPRLSLHTKFVLTVTGSLLALGTVSYYGLERSGVLGEMTFGEALLNAWFCSVTARTAGFNTVDYAQLGSPALLCTMVLMFIGASPGSTGGGVKTSTFGILITYGLYRWRGHDAPHAFRRTIPREAVERATYVVIAGVAVVILASSFLMATEGRAGHPSQSQDQFLPVIFEIFSGFGTVGLSMNFTSRLSDAGKLVICVVMFLGRIGPLTAALAVGTRRKQAKFHYAEENVMVG
jgi:trk system potassium uptake protein TrkH